MSDTRMRTRIMFAATAAISAAMPVAAQPVSIDTKIFVETYVTANDGTMERKLKPASTVVPGDRLVYVISYRNAGSQPAADFQITNPIPAGVELVGDETAGAEMSADGGMTWAPLAQLSIHQTSGTARPARRSEVTHIRWRFAQPIPAGGNGQVTFRTRLK